MPLISALQQRSTGLRSRLVGNHLVRGSVVLLLGSLAAALAGYAYWTYLSRRFGASVVGEVSALGAAAAVVSLLHAQSVGASVLSRMHGLVRSAQRAMVYAVVVMVGLSGALGGLLGGLLLLVAADVTVLGNPVLFVLFVVGVSAQSVGATLDMAALSLRSSRLSALRNGASSLLRLPLLVLLAGLAGGVGGVASALAVSSVVSILSVLWLTRVLVRLTSHDGDSVALSSVSSALRRGAGPQTLVALGSSMPAQALPVLVVALAGSNAGGHFSIAWLVGSTCFMIPPMVCSTLLAEGARELEALDRRVLHASALIAGLLALPIAVYLFAGERVLDLFGEGFGSGGAAVLVILALSAVPNTAMHVAVSVLRAQERLGSAARVSVLGGSVTLVLAAALVPVAGAFGAGLGWFGGQMVGAAAGVHAWRATRP